MKRAFTLVEILVVLAIITALLAVAFPVYQRSKASANITSSKSKMRQWSVALAMYREDHDGGAILENNPSSELTAMGFGTLSNIGQYYKFPRSMYLTGGSARPSIGVPVYCVFNSESHTGEFLRRYRATGDSTVWLIDITQNPPEEIDYSGAPRLVLGARLDTSVSSKRVRGDLTRRTIWDSEGK